MSADRLDKIKARADAATEGPWVRDWTHRHPGCPDDGHVSEYC